MQSIICDGRGPTVSRAGRLCQRALHRCAGHLSQCRHDGPVLPSKLIEEELNTLGIEFKAQHGSRVSALPYRLSLDRDRWQLLHLDAGNGNANSARLLLCFRRAFPPVDCAAEQYVFLYLHRRSSQSICCAEKGQLQQQGCCRSRPRNSPRAPHPGEGHCQCGGHTDWLKQTHSP
jgi:hypothetical protein